MTGASSLPDLLDELATDVEAVERTSDGGSVAYATRGQDFAVLDQIGASFRLRADVVRGALGTPDTAASPRGPDWVRFAPPVLDTFARDRAEAWFRFAHRLVSRPAKGSGQLH